MPSVDHWIWLPETEFPHCQTTTYSTMSGQDQLAQGNYAVARFWREYTFAQPIAAVALRTSADSFFRLAVNDIHCVTGPASVGGDFLNNDRPRGQFYATQVTMGAGHAGFAAGRLAFSALVRMQPLKMFEYSMGRGGFLLTALVTFADGSSLELAADESWQAQHLAGHTAPEVYDGTVLPSAPCHAAPVADIWHCRTAPIPPVTETPFWPGAPVTVPAGQRVEYTLPLDRIYTGYPLVQADCAGPLQVRVRCAEQDEPGHVTHCTFVRQDSYTGTALCAAGLLQVSAVNNSGADAVLQVGFLRSHYPVSGCAVTETGDKELGRVLQVCTHTLQYCRQTLHLDSGTHCEPLACTGDYYIEALMTAFTFGDLRLAAFDVLRTAHLLRDNGGRMFHTTYSLIWVLMLWDVYLFTGDSALLAQCKDALDLLLARFAGYLGPNGLVETPPDYMFIDWLAPDGISTHHPPKALGQTCLNLFYYGALDRAAEVYAVLGQTAAAQACAARAAALRQAICTILYDRQAGLFFEGLNTPTPAHLLGQYMPQNVKKRYYRKHANILAAYFGVLPAAECRTLLHRVMADGSLGEIQPYFAHFLLEAVYRNGLREVYTLQILEDWKAPVRECPKGLAEGFHKPEPGYSFDHSHAWGGTPAYALPLALAGFAMAEPGFKRIRLAPSLLGLTQATVQIPTPYGVITVAQRAGQAPAITVPAGIAYTVQQERSKDDE